EMASWIRSLALAVVFLAPIGAPAQTTSPGAQAAPVAQHLKPEELDQLVAPIALYPDPLLAEVLMASAYPIEVVQAERWLESTKEQTVTAGEVQGKRVIAIEPSNPETVYVPYYDPSVVYGAWPYADYPPYYWPPPPYIGYGLLAAGLAFGAGWAIANWGGYWN